jgi:hypothetical protein
MSEISEESRHELIEVIRRTFSGGTEENYEKSQVSQCPRWHSNQGPHWNKSLCYCYTILLGKVKKS